MGSASIRIGITANDQSAPAIAAAQARIRAFKAESETAGKGLEYSMREARGAIMLVGEEIGVKLNRHVAGFLASIPALGSAFAAAFSVVAIVKFGQEIYSAIQKTDEATKIAVQSARTFSESIGKGLADSAVRSDEFKLKLAELVHGPVTELQERLKASKDLLEGFKISGELKSQIEALTKSLPSSSNWNPLNWGDKSGDAASRLGGYGLSVQGASVSRQKELTDMEVRRQELVLQGMQLEGKSSNAALENQQKLIRGLKQIQTELAAKLKADQDAATYDSAKATAEAAKERARQLKEAAKAAEKLAEEMKKLQAASVKANQQMAASAFFKESVPFLQAQMAGAGGEALQSGGLTPNQAVADKYLQNIKDTQGWFQATRTEAEKFAVALKALDDLQKAGTIDQDTYNRAKAQLSSGLSEMNLKAQQFGQNMGQALEQGVLMGRKWSDVLKTLLLDMVKLVAQLTIMDALNSTMKGGGNQGFLASIASGFFGGHRAGGGAVEAGMAYLTGESGPELFIPRSSGTIVPHGGFGGAPIYNIDARGADISVEQRLRRVMQDHEDRAVTRSMVANREVSLRR